MSDIRILEGIVVCVAMTTATRFIPFVFFRNEGSVSNTIDYMGKVLPLSVMCILVVYSIKSINFAAAVGFVPYLIGIALTILVHLLKRNNLLSIFAGTAAYMLLSNLL